MLMSGLFGEDLFDEFWGFPTHELANIDKHLYGKNARNLMKTDVHETDDEFEIETDLPGFKKEEITLELNDGYLTVSAAKGLDQDEKKKGKLIRQERYAGAMQRSFYVGEGLSEEDIKAEFKHGVLNLLIAKKEKAKLPEKKQILISG